MKKDVVIIGGSYAGLSAGLILGRSLRHIVIIDDGRPCNKPTEHAHNLLAQDGVPPSQIRAVAMEQLSAYGNVAFLTGTVAEIKKLSSAFEVVLSDRTVIHTKKVVLSTGVKDVMPAIIGFSECWGRTIIHCPYCHGYEVQEQKIGILANGETALEFCKLILNWSSRIVLLTNGPSEVPEDQKNILESLNISIVEQKIQRLEHRNGKLDKVIFSEGSELELDAIFSRVPFTQHSDLAKHLGCDFTPDGLIKIDELNRTSVEGVYAAGDNSNLMRALSIAIASGTRAGAFLNKELIEEKQ